MNTGQRIKEARENLALTQEELGQKIGVTGVTVMRYEKGQREPRLEQLQAIADALNVTVGYLQGYEAKETKRIIAAVKRKDYRELERLMDLPEGSISVLPSSDEIDSALYEAAQLIAPTERYIQLEKLKTDVICGFIAVGVDSQIAKRLVAAFVSLTPTGQHKAVERVEELTEIPKYQREKPQDMPTTPTEGNTTPPESPLEEPPEGK